MCVFSLLSELICGFLFSPRQGWQCGVRCEWVLHLYFALSLIFLSLFCLCLKVPGLVAADENVCSPFFFITDGWKFIDCLTSLVFPVCVSAEGLCFSVLFISFYSSIFQTLWLSRYQSFSFDFHCTSATILTSVRVILLSNRLLHILCVWSSALLRDVCYGSHVCAACYSTDCVNNDCRLSGAKAGIAWCCHSAAETTLGGGRGGRLRHPLCLHAVSYLCSALDSFANH